MLPRPLDAGTITPDQMQADVPRPEHPRPQFVRPNWLSLNGEWQFEIDQGDSGLERGLVDRPLTGRIRVPFAPEAELSGVGKTDFLEAVWYRRLVNIPAEWGDKRTLLHFQAIDYDATVWVNGEEVARHRGGFTPFTVDLGQPAREIRIAVRARDPRHGSQPRGKQSILFANRGVHYTRTTGIWQTVWLEAVAHTYLLRARITPDVGESAFHIEARVSANRRGWAVRATLSDDAGRVATSQARADFDRTPRLTLLIPRERVRLWAPGQPHLYGLRLELLDEREQVVDTLESYAGLRSISLDGNAFLINGKPIFQRLVLDQGYWPDGLMTAPSESALSRDIELSQAAGFNGARLHQKVFEERFLYHADRLGYVVWGEFGDWGLLQGGTPSPSIVAQWLEAVDRDYSHPAIVGWCPLNETAQPLEDRITALDDVTRALFFATKAADPTRAVLDTSGYAHRVPETDVFDSHLYEQDPARFAEAMAAAFYINKLDGRPMSVAYRGQPYFCSEFGGIWWDPNARHESSGSDREASWGYGRRPADEREFVERFTGLVNTLLDDPRMFGYCYTQLTDIFQERNGIYRFDRSNKLDVSLVRSAQLRAAAYEV